MKKARYFFGATLVMISIWVFAGCADNQQASAPANAYPAAKTYESQDLARTGRRTSGEALQAADPSVTARGGN
jgi:hypothetical protein